MRYLVAAALLAGCSGESEAFFPVTCPGEGDYPFADVVVSADGEAAGPSSIQTKQNAVNGVRGNAGGSKDVFSRGYDVESGSHEMVLRWSGRRVENVDGNDFTVFENAFDFAGGTFMDLVIVSVSSDGESWETFPFDYVAEDETTYQSDRSLWQGFAGRTPVTYDSDDSSCNNPMDGEGGGDAFDLADIGVDSFVFLKLTAAPTVVNPDTGEPFVRDPIADGFDIDGVYAAEATPE